MNKLLLLLLILFSFILPLSEATATVRYVSKTGTAVPPYLTWETASDSIQKCINVSAFGDTIYVANGVYKERSVMIPGLAMIGSGWDSCIINTTEFSNSGYAFHVSSNSLLMGFQIIVSNSRENEGIGCVGDSTIIKLNKILNASTGIWFSSSKSKAENNILINMDLAIFADNSGAKIINNNIIGSKYGLRAIAFDNSYHINIENNIMEVSNIGVIISIGTKPTITNNIILLDGNFAVGYEGGGSDTAKIYNNLIIAKLAFWGINNSIIPHLVYNNFVIGNITDRGIDAENYNVIKNNVVMDGYQGMYKDEGENPVVEYNNSWNNEINYANIPADTTNISVDPMVVSEDSMNFHLQKYSPLIDRGDPAILDKDSTRSDIGLYGNNIFGQSYKYLDLPPKVPRGLTASYDTASAVITVKWKRNTEADFSSYKLYRDTVQGFTADTSSLAAELTDTFYTHIVLPGVNKYYYKILALDGQGNASELSEELAVIITGTGSQVQLSYDYKLFQNYPNPFNPSTVISYRLKSRGYVKLMIYTLNGELLQSLANGYEEAGYYEKEFIPGREISSGIYIYRIDVKGENNIPVYSDMKKMILLK